MRISVVGLGKIGACMAAVFAHRGFPTLGVDVNPRVVRLVNGGEPPVFEPGLKEMMAGAGASLRAVGDAREAVCQSDVTFIVVATPSEEDGGFSVRYVEQAAREIGRALRDKEGYHLVVLTSTVLPGATESALLPVLLRESGKRCPEDFGVCYNPEFVALGSVLRDLLNPAVVLIGESDGRAGDLLSSFYLRVCENEPCVARMNYVNAELVKISVNTYLTMKITFANLVRTLSERLPGGDVDVVTAAVGKDPRICSLYMRGGLGYGGPCFPRDNLALACLARRLGVGAELPEAVDRTNRGLAPGVAERVLALAGEGSRVAVLGLAYKPNTDVIQESQALDIVRLLRGRGLGVIVYDRFALDNVRGLLAGDVEYAGSVSECVRGADAVVLASPEPALGLELAETLRGMKRPPRVVDCWRALDRGLLGDGVVYIGLGLGEAAGSGPESQRTGGGSPVSVPSGPAGAEPL
jgi:UDPglucose 6-dehydrogenase